MVLSVIFSPAVPSQSSDRMRSGIFFSFSPARKRISPSFSFPIQTIPQPATGRASRPAKKSSAEPEKSARGGHKPDQSGANRFGIQEQKSRIAHLENEQAELESEIKLLKNQVAPDGPKAAKNGDGESQLWAPNSERCPYFHFVSPNFV